MKLIYEKSQPGRRGIGVPKPDLPVPEVPADLARKELPRLPELAEPEVLRHFTELSTRNFGIDTGFYPLGSCTMKYNPRVNERVVGLPGFEQLHPLVEDDPAQGALELEWHLQEHLVEITGLDEVFRNEPLASGQRRMRGPGAQIETDGVRSGRRPGRPQHQAPTARPWPKRVDQQRYPVRGQRRSRPLNSMLAGLRKADRIGRVRGEGPHAEMLTISAAKSIGLTTAFGVRQRSWSKRVTAGPPK